MVPWIDEEIESAILLQRILENKEQRLAHLNARYGNSRSYTSFKARVEKARRPQNINHHLHQKYKAYPDDNGAAIVSLARLLGRNLVLEGQSLWYKEELIALAACSSGLTLLSAVHKIRKRLEDEYQIPRGDEEIRGQLGRMQLPINVQSESHSIWLRYHQSGPSQAGLGAHVEAPRRCTVGAKHARVCQVAEWPMCVRSSDDWRRFEEYNLGKQGTMTNKQGAMLKPAVVPVHALEAPSS
ncbi:MAG: hypothetical protein Q9207_006283 [Kuettlingeria erythrocarpa]